MLVAHPTFHMSKLKPIHEDKKRKARKQAYHPIFDFIEHKFAREMECILVAKQTKWLSKQYWVKWKGCHPKELQWVKPVHLDHLPKMVKKFEQERGHKMGNRKTHKNKSNTKT